MSRTNRDVREEEFCMSLGGMFPENMEGLSISCHPTSIYIDVPVRLPHIGVFKKLNEKPVSEAREFWQRVMLYLVEGKEFPKLSKRPWVLIVCRTKDFDRDAGNHHIKPLMNAINDARLLRDKAKIKLVIINIKHDNSTGILITDDPMEINSKIKNEETR